MKQVKICHVQQILFLILYDELLDILLCSYVKATQEL